MWEVSGRLSFFVLLSFFNLFSLILGIRHKISLIEAVDNSRPGLDLHRKV